MDTPLILLRCRGCGRPLVEDRGDYVCLKMSEIRFYKDTGKVTSQCRRCPVGTVLDAGSPVLTGQSLAVRLAALVAE